MPPLTHIWKTSAVIAKQLEKRLPSTNHPSPCYGDTQKNTQISYCKVWFGIKVLASTVSSRAWRKYPHLWQPFHCNLV